MARRARIVLAAASGLENKAICVEVGADANTVGKWRRRFAEHRYDGLLDEPRPGAPRKIGDNEIADTIRLTLEAKPAGATPWSLRSMARSVGYALSTIHRIWRAFSLQPHRTETFKLSNDPLFVEKVRDIVGLYLSPPERALALCVDKKSQIQALDRSQPLLPMRPGQVERRTHDYTRHGTTSGQRCWCTKAKHLASSMRPERLIRSGAVMTGGLPRARQVASRSHHQIKNPASMLPGPKPTTPDPDKSLWASNPRPRTTLMSLPTQGGVHEHLRLDHMSIFGSIMSKIFHTGSAAEATPDKMVETASQTTPDAGPPPTTQASPAEPKAPSTASPSAPSEPVDVEAVLAKMAGQKGGGGNYKSSIVDLMKLLDLDSSLSARKELADELNLHVGADGSSEENIALHKAVMKKLAENGGKVPDSFKN